MYRLAIIFLLLCSPVFGQVAQTGGGKATAGAGAAAPTLDPAKTAAKFTLSGGNLTATTNTTDAGGVMSLATTSHSTGSYYFEVNNTVNAGGSGTVAVGFANVSQSFANAHFLGETGSNSVGYFANASVYVNNVSVGTGVNWNQTRAGVAVDLTARKIWVTLDGVTWNNDIIANQNPVGGIGGISFSGVTGAVFAGVEADIATSALVIAFSGFTFSAPVGYGAW